ncbi:MAG TPA: 3-deoxy-manno-octulosonate cytidylyltransferase [Burkholderiales bacterium]|nr:3-deoxy-manno-octulosonate cytidylyltransferase [Burkholderiales bacterium]
MDFVVIIPARYASTRFPGKPLADLDGRPIVVRVADRAQKSGAREVLVATDHPSIAEAVRDYGYTAVMTRRSHASGTDRVAEVVTRRRFPAQRIIVNVQGDEPLIEPLLIRKVAEDLARHRAAQIATACTPIRDSGDFANPNIVKVVLDNQRRALYFSRAPIPHVRDARLESRATVPEMPRGLPAYRHLGIYAYRCGFLRRFARLKPAAIERCEALEQLRALAHGFGISVVITRRATHPGIDTPQDLERARARLRRKR